MTEQLDAVAGEADASAQTVPRVAAMAGRAAQPAEELVKLADELQVSVARFRLP